MRDTFLRRFRYGVIFLVVIGLASCSSSGDDDDDDFGIDDADATGIWSGTSTPGGGSAVPANAVVAPNGRFVVVTGPVYLSGTGSTDGFSFSANATGWPPANTVFANGSAMASFTITGSVIEETSLSGTYSGANESGSLSLTYDAAGSNRSASLATVSGSYMTSSGATSIAINNSALTFNSTVGPNMNCVGNGTVSVPDATRNVYVWNMSRTGCNDDGAADGLAYLIGNNQMVMVGRSPNGPFALVATK